MITRRTMFRTFLPFVAAGVLIAFIAVLFSQSRASALSWAKQTAKSSCVQKKANVAWTFTNTLPGDKYASGPLKGKKIFAVEVFATNPKTGAVTRVIANPGARVSGNLPTGVDKLAAGKLKIRVEFYDYSSATKPNSTNVTTLSVPYKATPDCNPASGSNSDTGSAQPTQEEGSAPKFSTSIDCRVLDEEELYTLKISQTSQKSTAPLSFNFANGAKLSSGQNLKVVGTYKDGSSQKTVTKSASLATSCPDRVPAPDFAVALRCTGQVDKSILRITRNDDIDAEFSHKDKDETSDREEVAVVAKYEDPIYGTQEESVSSVLECPEEEALQKRLQKCVTVRTGTSVDEDVCEVCPSNTWLLVSDNGCNDADDLIRVELDPVAEVLSDTDTNDLDGAAGQGVKVSKVVVGLVGSHLSISSIVGFFALTVAKPYKSE